jgi:hypothetical protein
MLKVLAPRVAFEFAEIELLFPTGRVKLGQFARGKLGLVQQAGPKAQADHRRTWAPDLRLNFAHLANPRAGSAESSPRERDALAYIKAVGVRIDCQVVPTAFTANLDFSLELIRCGWRDHAAENSDGGQRKESEITHLPGVASQIAFVIRSKMTVESFASDLV